jgi:hypothetical protein
MLLRVRFSPLSGGTAGRLRRELLAEMAQRKDLNAILKDLVQDPVGLVEHLAHGGLVPFRNHPPLIGEVPKEFDASNQRLNPLV